MEINKDNVGKRIKKIRVDRGWSLEAFGEKIEDPPVKPGIISRWENGKSLPNNQRIKAIADIGGITVDELLHGNQKDRLYNLLCSAIDENSEVYSEDLYNRIIEYLDVYENLTDILFSLQDLGNDGDYEEESIRNFIRTNIDSFIKYNLNIDFNQPEQIIESFIQYINIVSSEVSKTFKGAETVIMNAVNAIDPYSYTTETVEEYVRDHDKMGMTKDQAIEQYFIFQLYDNVQNTVLKIHEEYWTYKNNEENKEI